MIVVLAENETVDAPSYCIRISKLRHKAFMNPGMRVLKVNVGIFNISVENEQNGIPFFSLTDIER